MSNYNSQLQSNNTDLQTVLQTLQTKAAGSGGEQVTPVISVNSSGLITAIAGVKSSTHQLAFQPATTIIPSTASQIAVSGGYYTGGNITVAGDVNLVAGNIKSGVSIFGVNGTLVEGGSSEDGYDEADSLINMNMFAYANSRVANIGRGAFAYALNLTSVDFPNVTTIHNSAFYHCSKLETVSFPVCTTIHSSAFAYCRSLTTVSFPSCTFIGNYAFCPCYNLTTVSFPNCTTIGSSAFASCSKLTTVSFPVCTTISSYAFTYCSKLTTASFPECTTIGSNAFQYCSNLTTVSFPKCTTIGSAAFASCYNLTTVSFPKCTTIGSDAFWKCYNLKSLYLTGSSLCTLSNSNAFTSTPIGGYSASAGTYGSIYVPASLLTSYQTATNWTYFSSRFVAFDGIITFTIDGIEYQAEDGMTWTEWVNSEYNTNSFYIDGNLVLFKRDGYVVPYYIVGVSPTDAVNLGTQYTTRQVGADVS